MDEKIEHLREKLKEARVKQEVRWLVEKVSISLWQELERIKSSDEDRDKALELIAKLAKGHDIKEDEDQSVWIQAKPGALTVGDYVRVKKDAFSHQPAASHNGMEGRIVALRYGDVYVKYNEVASITGMNSVKHSADSLEKRTR